ncbi:MAG: cyclic pyranopterin monophosphate synthase MoaC [Verrucomicrobia bacterium]|nr:cyclic pyranopterin monophosphate synthase MoaC [Verrucomicrobiota bacterium]
MKRKLSHVANDGKVRMVDVSGKPQSVREAIATGAIHVNRETVAAISRNEIAKGNVLATAQVAGIQAAKRTAELIPLCHPLPLSHVGVELELKSDAIVATCSARTTAQTGVEMEALTGAVVALLAIYDMCKAIDGSMHIGDVRLLKKTKRLLQNSDSPARGGQRRRPGDQ